MLSNLQQLEIEQIRRNCRKSLRLFCHYVAPSYINGQHLDRIAMALERVERGELTRLIVTIPPRHGKSTLISQKFPCWYLGRHPEREILQTGYSDDIACFHSWHARNLFASYRFNDVFPGVSKAIGPEAAKKQAVHEWRTKKDGSYRAAGIRSGISGRGADIILIDDPVKNREEANSKLVRDAILNEYRSTLLTRLSPIGAVILIMTRWHQDDLAGRLIAEAEGEGIKWEVINLPAINESGEALWPARYPIEKLQEIKRGMGSADFEALYQQNPRPPGCGIFKRDWFEIVEAAPVCAKNIRYWDRAATESNGKNDPDWTAGLRYGRAPNGTFYVHHVNRFQGSPLKVEQSIITTASQDGKAVMIGIEQDPGQAGKADGMNYVRLLAGYTVKLYPVSKAKALRAAPVAAQAEAGNVKLVRGPWNEPFLQELENFTGDDGTHDDQVDALSGAHNGIASTQLIYLA